MSTELQEINIGGDELKDFAELLGVGETKSDLFPIVKVTTKGRDAQGREIGRGMLWLKSNDLEPVYAKTMKIRPLSNVYQYTHWDDTKGENVNSTIQSPTFKTEFRDRLGTLKCGRPDNWYSRPDDEKKKWSGIKCNRIIRAIVTYTGKDADGNEVTIENKPVIIFNKSSNFGQFDDQYLKVIPKQRKLYDYWVEVSVKDHSNGGLEYYTMEYKPDFKVPVSMDQMTLDTLRVIVDVIKTGNASVNKDYANAIQERSMSDVAMDAIAEGELSELEQDMV